MIKLCAGLVLRSEQSRHEQEVGSQVFWSLLQSQQKSRAMGAQHLAIFVKLNFDFFSRIVLAEWAAKRAATVAGFELIVTKKTTKNVH